MGEDDDEIEVNKQKKGSIRSSIPLFFVDRGREGQSVGNGGSEGDSSDGDLDDLAAQLKKTGQGPYNELE